MLATAGWPARWLPVTQSTPAMTHEVRPTPAHDRTRTATRVTDFATPYVAPPMVPETWVPCPLQSPADPPGMMASNPVMARPPKSAWVRRIPVSITYAFTPAPVFV